MELVDFLDGRKITRQNIRDKYLKEQQQVCNAHVFSLSAFGLTCATHNDAGHGGVLTNAAANKYTTDEIRGFVSCDFYYFDTIKIRKRK